MFVVNNCPCIIQSNFQPITRVYFFLCLAQIILYAETGAVPALLVDMTSKFSLTFPEQGNLGGIVYLGLALGPRSDDLPPSSNCRKTKRAKQPPEELPRIDRLSIARSAALPL